LDSVSKQTRWFEEHLGSTLLGAKNCHAQVVPQPPTHFARYIATCRLKQAAEWLLRIRPGPGWMATTRSIRVSAAKVSGTEKDGVIAVENIEVQ
jgi:hypothetical protein